MNPLLRWLMRRDEDVENHTPRHSPELPRERLRLSSALLKAEHALHERRRLDRELDRAVAAIRRR
jgi:hypothetical protein